MFNFLKQQNEFFEEVLKIVKTVENRCSLSKHYFSEAKAVLD